MLAKDFPFLLLSFGLMELGFLKTGSATTLSLASDILIWHCDALRPWISLSANDLQASVSISFI